MPTYMEERYPLAEFNLLAGKRANSTEVTTSTRGSRGVQSTIIKDFTVFRSGVAITTALALALVSAAPAALAAGEVAEKGIAHQLVTSEKLPNVPGQTFTAVRVDLAPGGVSPSHRHPGFVFAYVLSGTVRSQLDDGPVTDYRTGQGWVEPPGTLHRLTQNPSASEPASLLAVWVAEDGAALLLPADH